MMRILRHLLLLLLLLPAAADPAPGSGRATEPAPPADTAQDVPATPSNTGAPRRRSAKDSKKPAVPSLKERMAPLLETCRPYVIPGSVGLGVLVLAVGFGLWRRSRAQHRFPEFAVEPRLGGKHAAGVGGIISFADPSVPPSAQHHSVPDSIGLP